MSERQIAMLNENQMAIIVIVVVLILYGINLWLRNRYRAREEMRQKVLHNLAIQKPGRIFSAVGNPLFALNMLFDEEADSMTRLTKVENMIRGQAGGVEYELFDLVFLKSLVLSVGWWGERRTGVARIMLDGKHYPKFLIRPRRRFSRRVLSNELLKLRLDNQPALRSDIELYSLPGVHPVRVLTPAVVTFLNKYPDTTLIGNENQLGLYSKAPIEASESGLAEAESIVAELAQAFDRAVA